MRSKVGEKEEEGEEDSLICAGGQGAGGKGHREEEEGKWILFKKRMRVMNRLLY